MISRARIGRMKTRVNIADAVAAAAERLAPYRLETPLLPARSLANHAHYKCENLQLTGSFKIRCALN